ncbi:hypothetical protein F5I97DRAFT_1904215 [Phlebopus sp. FC_14]|nr:hypothetical protein F5I97DRAFT_1904215 [Phlebopus sp. FC_14]
MAHRCVDWTVSPPTRKTPLVVLSYGDTHVYATVPEELEALGDVARTEFGLGDVKLEFYSSCVNLCSDAPARIGPPVWEHIRPFVGCISVVVNSISSEPGQVYLV